MKKIDDASAALWSALEEGKIAATAFHIPAPGELGRVVDIPAREWPFLETHCDLEGHDRLHNKNVPYGVRPESDYSEIRFLRAAIVDCWPAPRPAKAKPDAGTMALPRIRADSGEDYISLTDAALWIATGGSNEPVALECYGLAEAYKKLLAAVAGGKLGAIARRNGAAVALAGVDLIQFRHVKVALPLSVETGANFDGNGYIEANFALDGNHWEGGFDDQFYRPGAVDPHWTHLEVNSAGVLEFWPAIAGQTAEPLPFLTIEDAENLIREAFEKSPTRFLTLADGEALLKGRTIIIGRRKHRNTRPFARDIVKALTGNDKPGPRGPRINSAK